MAWQDEKPPWGKPGGPSSPEDLITALIKKLKESFSGIGIGKGQGGDGSGAPTGVSSGPGGGIGKIIMIIAAVLIFQVAYSSFYTIKPGERGVVLRFGKYIKTANPGLNFKVPLIDDMIKVDVETVRKEEFGFRTKMPGRQTVYQRGSFDSESLMLTADKNVIDVEWIVQYKISDPFKYLFRVKNVSQAVRDLNETALRRIIGNMDFDYVLANRDILAAETARELQKSLDRYESGIAIITVQLQDVNPPETVKPAFNEVNEADQDMKRLVNEAEEAYNRVIPKASGQAKEMLEESHGYAVERVNTAKGDTARFLAVMKEYKAAKDVTRQRLYLEAMQDVLPRLSDIYVIDKDQQSILPLLNLTGSKTVK